METIVLPCAMDLDPQTIRLLIIVGTLLAVVSGGLAIFFWWRMQYGVWSRDRRQRDRVAGPMITNDFSTVNRPNDVAAAGMSASEAERARLHQLGLAAGMLSAGIAADAAQAITPKNRDGSSGGEISPTWADDLARGKVEPPATPAGDPPARPAEWHSGGGHSGHDAGGGRSSWSWGGSDSSSSFDSGSSSGGDSGGGGGDA
jgi:hypothetical protein